jgi:hypothetical protein
MQQENSNNYCLELPNLWYDRPFLENHMNSIDMDNWYLFDCGHVRWTVHEEYQGLPKIECKNYPWTEFHQELALLFNPKIVPDTMLYTTASLGGVPPHQDRNRLCILNFAIRGKFSSTSPQTFYKEFDQSTLEYTMEYNISNQTNEFAPWLFKGSKIHGVKNYSDPDRAILTVCWRHNTYEDIIDRLYNDTLINWDQNAKNKYIKFLK